mgnify:FL=1
MMMKQQQLAQQKQKGQISEEQQPIFEEWRKWKQLNFEIAGRAEVNYDLSSVFGIDLTKVLAVQVYIQVTDLASGEDRFIQHIIPVFTRDVVYDIRPLEFEAGVRNEFEILAKRPDGKPTKLENLIVTLVLIVGDEQGKVKTEKEIEIKEFYGRGRNDIGLFNVEIPADVIGVLIRITPLSEDGQVRGYRTHAVPLMPTPRRANSGGKLSIELLPAPTNLASNDVNEHVVSSQISTVGRTSNFYVQLIPTGAVQKVEPLPVSYVLLTNGRITLTGEFTLEPSTVCGSKSVRSVEPDVQGPPACVFNGTLPIQITRAMIPYSTLLVYTFQPTFGFHVAESYRFSVAGLFQNPLVLNAAVVPYSEVSTLPEGESESSDEQLDSKENVDLSAVTISPRAQDKSRVQLSFTGAPGSTVGLNVIEYDGIMQGLANEITKERVLQYLTAYEQVPIVGMPTRRGFPQDLTGEQAKRKIEEQNGEDAEKRFVSEQDEVEQGVQERLGSRIRYPVEKMVFGITSNGQMTPIEGDDAYVQSNLGALYGDRQTQPQSPYRRRILKAANQYDVSVGSNEVVIATSMPLSAKTAAVLQQKLQEQVQHNAEQQGQSPQYGTPSWYEKASSKLNTISQEAFTFMHSGLSIVSDFTSLQVPEELRRANLTKLFGRFREQSLLVEPGTFSIRDGARQLLEEYLAQADLSMIPPPMLIEEQARNNYFRSIFFNTSVIESQGTGKVVLPRTKPYSTWLATGFALNKKSGLSIARPIGLPTNQGLFILANFPQQVQIGEHVLLTYGINNYLGKDVSNVVVRIRASADFDLIEQAQPERVVATSGKDYTVTIPAIKLSETVTRNLVLVPKRAGVVKILLEVESEFGGDYEVLTTYVRESGVERRQISARIFDLNGEQKSYGPIVEKITQSPALRSVRVTVSGTGLDRLALRNTFAANSLVGVDRAIISLWRLLGLRNYLNDTNQVSSPLYESTVGNITAAYQKLQLYSLYNGSYTFVTDRGEEQSSLYLTTLALGALISPLMPVRDNVTLNRTLSWVLSHQQQDGSFVNSTSCFHYRFCAGPFRQEALTALVLYSLTHNNILESVPEYVRRQLIVGEQSPVFRAQQYLLSRLNVIKSDLLTTALVQLALLQSPLLPAETRQQIFETVRSKQLTVVPEDKSKYVKVDDVKFTVEDSLLLNSLTLSIYSVFGDQETTFALARWIVEQIESHPHFDTVLDGVFITDAWLNSAYLTSQHIQSGSYSVVVDVVADNGQKQQFKIDAANADLTQKFDFTLPVNKITYTVSGVGAASVVIRQVFVEKQQQPTSEPVPFQLNAEFLPLPWLNQITSRTCLTYTPTVQTRKFADDVYNRTIVAEIQLPTGSRVDLRQLGFFVSRVPEVVYFTYNERSQRISFFLNVPSTVNGKQICFEWLFERLSTVTQWAPIGVRAYDYLQPEIQLVRIIPIDFKPSDLLGYSFVDAVQKARPTTEQLVEMQKHQFEHLSTPPTTV